MDEQRVKAANRCPSARFIFTAVLPAHRLVFISSGEDGSCAADAIPDPASVVWGVVYDITDSDRQQLDAREGAGVHTHRPKEVLVHPHGDSEQRVIVLTYSTREATEMQLPPGRENVDHLLRGARRWGLPAQYIQQIEKMEAGR